MKLATFLDGLIIAGLVVTLVALAVARDTKVLSDGVIGALIAVAVVTALLLILKVGAWRARRERERFVAGRVPLSNDDFLAQMAAGGDYARFCLIVRNGFAIDCGVAAEMIRPEDTLPQLEQLCFDGFYLHEIVFWLEDEMPRYAADLRGLNSVRNWKTMSLRDLIEGAAKELGLVSDRQASTPGEGT